MGSQWKLTFAVVLMVGVVCHCVPPRVPRPEGKSIRDVQDDDQGINPNKQLVYVFADASGSSRFTSPAHPDDYKNNIQIHYEIIAPQGNHIRLDAEIYDLSEGNGSLIFSEYDPDQGYVTIGSFDNSVNGRRSLESKTPYVFASVIMESLTGRRGFSIVATSYSKGQSDEEPPPTEPPQTTLAPHVPVVPTVVQVDVGLSLTIELTSPGYPQPYENNLEVYYLIDAQEGQIIRFSYGIFFMEPYYYDRLEFSEYIPGEGNAIIARFTGGSTFAQFTSRTNHVVATFYTDSSVADKGFIVQAYSVDATKSGTDIDY